LADIPLTRSFAHHSTTTLTEALRLL
jgi:hypothetical protein